MKYLAQPQVLEDGGDWIWGVGRQSTPGANALDEGPRTFPVKGQVVNVLGSASQPGFVAPTWFCPWSTGIVTDDA